MKDSESDQTTSINISSNVLFHFTHTKQTLLSILGKGFWPSYCPEYSVYDDDSENARTQTPPFYARPMVSFCDLPLFLIKAHLRRYGPYGIGMRKSWALQKGISPVFYAHNQSTALTPMKHLFQTSERIDKDAAAYSLLDDLLMLSAYVKKYEGIAWRDKSCTNTIRFYNEREWRYVPSLLPANRFMLTRKSYTNEALFQQANEDLGEPYSLAFDAHDVEYIIVDRKAELIPFLEELKGLGKRFSRNSIRVLQSALISSDKITEDF